MPRLEPPATMWTSHCLISAPAWGSGAGVGRLAHWSHPGGGTSSSGISTAVPWELPARAGSCRASTTTSDHTSAAVGSCCDTVGCTPSTGRASAAAVACCASTTAGARLSSTTADCGPAGDATGRGPETSATPCEPPLAAAAVLAPARGALDECRLVRMDASALSTLAGARGGTVGATL
jgi:hypothetical protein